MPFNIDVNKTLKYGIIIGASVTITAVVTYKVFNYQRRRRRYSDHKSLLPYEINQDHQHENNKFISDVIIDIPIEMIEETPNILQISDDFIMETQMESLDSSAEVFTTPSKEPVEIDFADDGFNEGIRIQRKILVLGLEHAGKSSLIAEISKDGSSKKVYEPTLGFNVVSISFENMDVNIWEIGGSEQYRGYWKKFYITTDLVLFLVDSTATKKFPDAKIYLYEIIENLSDDVEFSIVATKADQVDAVTNDELIDALGIDGMQWDIIRVATKCGGAKKNFGIDEIKADLCNL